MQAVKIQAWVKPLFFSVFDLLALLNNIVILYPFHTAEDIGLDLAVKLWHHAQKIFHKHPF